MMEKTTENRPNLDRTSAEDGLRIPSEVVRERAEHAAPGLLRHQARVRELLHGLGGHLAKRMGNGPKSGRHRGFPKALEGISMFTPMFRSILAALFF